MVKMSNVNLSLDEIITKNRSTRGAGRRAPGGGIRKSGGIAKRSFTGKSTTVVPSDKKWAHDGYFELYDGKKNARAGDVIEAISQSTAAVPSGETKVDISNLSFGVSTDDLNDLFGAYKIIAANVHYDATGNALGTGDVVFANGREAAKCIREFEGLKVDGRLLRMKLVGAGNVSAAASSRLAGRVTRIASAVASGNRSGSGPRRSGGSGRRVGIVSKRDGAPAGWGHDTRLMGLGEDAPAGGAARGRGAGGGKGRGGKKAQMTEAELDAELDAYMKKN